jgi:multiple sugar transport system permease protein
MPPLAKADLTNTYWSVILLLSVSPLGLYMCRIYAARGIPVEALEQARLDGVSERRIFWSIAFRMMTPVLATTFMMGFIST